MFVDRVELSFDAGHRILGHPGKCASPHGHTFKAEVFVVVQHLDGLGFALDFEPLKCGLKGWIDEHWDHGFLLNDADTPLVEALQAIPEAKLYLFQGVNPSAEAMARALFDEARRQFGCVVRSIRIWESPNQYAEFVPDEAPVPVRAQETSPR
jgi:6-pyruvoyltetrahydropterin/6-carboxytetrahydropterin synthase